MTWNDYLHELHLPFAQRVLLRGIFGYYATSFASKSFRFECEENEYEAILEEYTQQEREAWAALGVTPDLFAWMDAESDGGRDVYIVTPEVIADFQAARARRREDAAAAWLPFPAREANSGA